MTVRFQGAKKITNNKSQRGRQNDPDNVNKDSRLAHGLGSALGSVYSVRSPTQRALSLPKASISLSLSLYLDSPKMGKKCFQVKCLPDELFDETKDGRSDSLRVALNEIERTLVKWVGSAALAVIKRHAIDQTRR